MQRARRFCVLGGSGGYLKAFHGERPETILKIYVYMYIEMIYDVGG